jgi:hypothetical protein
VQFVIRIMKFAHRVIIIFIQMLLDLALHALQIPSNVYHVHSINRHKGPNVTIVIRDIM